MTKVTINPGTHLYPVPAVMVTCGPLEKPNIVTLSWVGTVCSDPPMVGISIRPSRYSYSLIKESGEFAVNLPTADLLRATDYCGTVSGSTVDKFAAAGLTPLPAKAIATAIIAECPVNMECKVRQVVTLGSHDLFLGEIVAVQVDDTVLEDEQKINLTKSKPLAFGAQGYWSLGELLGTYGYTAKTQP